MPTVRHIEPWEAALIKTMLASKAFTNDDIVAYFSRPDRTLNPFRLAEIRQGKLHKDVVPATDEQVTAFQGVYFDKNRARAAFFTSAPLHTVSMDLLLPIKEGTTDILHITETDKIECKQSLNWSGKADYAKTIVAFANAGGGYLLFGVQDADKKVVGIADGKLTGYDPAKLNSYLSSRFAPVPTWTGIEQVIAGKNVGVLAVPPARTKPIICIGNDGNTLKEGDVYYRYPGESRVIKPAELHAIIEERVRQAEGRWQGLLEKAKAVGVDNVAVFDTVSGEVSGPGGQFVIDEKLLDQLKFITEGSFSETGGDPTLRLIGDLQAKDMAVDSPTEVPTPVNLSDDELVERFLNRASVASPNVYVQHTALSPKKWLPIFYFVRLAGLSDADAEGLIGCQAGAKQHQVDAMKQRIGNRSVPPGAAQKHTVASLRSELLAKTATVPSSPVGWKSIFKAVRTLEEGEVDPNYLLPLLLKGWNASAVDGTLRSQALYAIAHVDVIWHRQSTSD